MYFLEKRPRNQYHDSKPYIQRKTVLERKANDGLGCDVSSHNRENGHGYLQGFPSQRNVHLQTRRKPPIASRQHGGSPALRLLPSQKVF